MNLISHANTKRNANTKLILSARTMEHNRCEEELFYSRRLININSTRELCVDKLSRHEIFSLWKYFESYGLWGEMTSLPTESKYQYLSNKCNSEFHGILLGLMNSPQIRERIRPIFTEVLNSESMMKTIIAAFTLNIVNINMPTFHMIAALTDESFVFSSVFRSNKAAGQLFNSSNGMIVPKSSVLAEFFLKNFPDTAILVKLLVEICKNTRKKADGNQLYFSIYRDVASFRYAQKLLPDNGKRHALISFYEGLRTIDVERKNPHFWLQYAIARLTYPDAENLAHAEMCLKTGLSLAKARPSYTTTDIETQYARYHLEYANQVLSDINLAYAEFIKANDILQTLTKKEKYRREAFRPARLYEAFYRKYSTQMTSEQINYLFNACDEIMKNIIKLPYKIREDKTVVASYESVSNTHKLISATR